MYLNKYVVITDRKFIGKSVLKEDEIVFARSQGFENGRKVAAVPLLLHSSLIGSIPILTVCTNDPISEAVKKRKKDSRYLAVISTEAADKIGAERDGDVVYICPFYTKED